MTSSAPVDSAMSTAVSNDHSEAVEKSVGIRMRRQGYIGRLLRIANCHLRSGLGWSHDVSNHRLRLRLGLHDLQRYLLVSGAERVAGDKGILHDLIELQFQCAPVLVRRIGWLGRRTAELREVGRVVVVDLRKRVVG